MSGGPAHGVNGVVSRSQQLVTGEDTGFCAVAVGKLHGLFGEPGRVELFRRQVDQIPNQADGVDLGGERIRIQTLRNQQFRRLPFGRPVAVEMVGSQPPAQQHERRGGGGEFVGTLGKG